LLALVFFVLCPAPGVLGLKNKPPAIERIAVACLVFLFYYFYVQTNNIFIPFHLFVSAISHPPFTPTIMATKLPTTRGLGIGGNE